MSTNPNRVQIDGALGGPYEAIGELIKRFHEEDCSGLRRTLVEALARHDFESFNRMLPINRNEFDTIRSECVEAWGEPS